MTAKFFLILALGSTLANQSWSSDWPQFLGPTRNGVYAGSDLAETWPKEGPPVIWQKSIGEGFSGPAVADRKLILFHRLKDNETIECLDSKTGKPLWNFNYPTTYQDDFGFDEGPRATPCIADGRVYTFGAEGMLTCLDFAGGKKIWGVDTKKEFGARKGFFGIVCSPIVVGNAVLLNTGGANGAGIVAFDKATGKVLWKTSDDEASYSAPTLATINGTRYGLFLTRSALVGLNPADGKVYFTQPFRPSINASVTAATPLVIGDLIFISASYGAGAALLRIKDGKPEKIWSAQDVLSNHYATSIYHDGFLYGIDGRTDPGYQPTLRCVDLKTGKIRWQQDDIGAATLTLAGDQLLILTEKGELIRAKASPEAFKSNARAEVFPNHVRAFPALSDGFLYARSKEKLISVNLSKSEPATKK
jgi:outer membrane protein assembly factor BamB